MSPTFHPELFIFFNVKSVSLIFLAFCTVFCVFLRFSVTPLFTVTYNCNLEMYPTKEAIFFYINLCPSAILDSFSLISFTGISEQLIMFNIKWL